MLAPIALINTSHPSNAVRMLAGVGVIDLEGADFRACIVLGQIPGEYMNSSDKVVSEKDRQYIVSKISRSSNKRDDHHASNADE
jgi:hypothetical protein